jgi:hypothetical protein
MSLDTVLKIGKAFRKSEDSLKYFTYIAPCLKNKEEWPLCITITIDNDFKFDWDNTKITPENEREKLYYLKYKTSDSDSSVKYIFGDIYYEKKAKVKKNSSIDSTEGGFYRLEDLAHRQSSFYRGENDYREIIQSGGETIEKFHNELAHNLILIERILNFIPAMRYFFNEEKNYSFQELLENENLLYELSIKQNLKKIGVITDFSTLDEIQKTSIFKLTNLSIFIHFEFAERKHWYQFDDDMDILRTKLLSEFVDNTDKGLVLKKTLYKTLCSGDKKNDIQFPNFLDSNKHKTKLFRNDTLQDLFYALNYTNQGRLILGTDIKLIVLPCGDNLTAADYEEFLKKQDENRMGAFP